MKNKRYSIILFCLLTFPVCAEKVLVKIGDTGQITDQQLEAAMKAAPFATQFPAMDEKDQAYLRGDMLLRLARAEALYQEAVETGKSQSDVFKQEMGNYRTTLLANRYLANLTANIQIPEKIQQQLAAKFQNNSDALAAARSAYIAKHFVRLKKDAIDKLIQQANIQTYFDALNHSPSADTVLAQGDNLLINYGDLFASENIMKIDNQRIKDKVNEWVKLIVMARAAEKQGESVGLQLKAYGHNLAIQLLLKEKEQQWLPDDKVLLDFFQKHPDIGYIPERRQIGQMVLASKAQAEQMRKRIEAGESLFKLAEEYSIDPYGREHSGDMGWLKEGSATQAIEQALKVLKDNEISPAIKTDKGWHLITIVSRKPSERKNFAAIKDRVKQKMIAEKMSAYIEQVVARHPLQWQMQEHNATGSGM